MAHQLSTENTSYISVSLHITLHELTKNTRSDHSVLNSSTTLISQSFQMKVKALVPFKSKSFSPDRKLFLKFRFKIRKPVFINALRSHVRRKKTIKYTTKNRILAGLLSVFRSPDHSTHMDREGELRSVSEAERQKKLLPSTLTPAYIIASRSGMKEAFGNENVDDACRSFENYLVEMIVEEGKVRDLMDVEELLYCWKNLQCPVFIDLVCRFYGELCKDLFSPDDNSDIDATK